MPTVIVTGNVYDHSDKALIGREVELWFRPNRPNVAGGALLSAKRVKAFVHPDTGAFNVELDNTPGIFYIAEVRYLTDPSDPELQGYDEWTHMPLFPGPVGGNISDLAPAGDMSIYTVLVSLNDPPAGYRGWWLHAGPGDPDNLAETGTGELRMVTGD